MSSTDKSKEENNGSQNAVIEIRISIPPLFRGGLGSILDNLGKAAGELTKAGRSMLNQDDPGQKKVRKIEIK